MNRLPATILYGLSAGLGLLGTVQPQSATLSGFVRASSNRESRSYVNVIVAGTNHDAATNRDGYYLISGFPQDTLTVVAAIMFTDIVGWLAYFQNPFPAESHRGRTGAMGGWRIDSGSRT